LAGRWTVAQYKKNSEAIRWQIKVRGWNEELQGYASVFDGHPPDSGLLFIY
jgi:hypothetical protein